MLQRRALLAGERIRNVMFGVRFESLNPKALNPQFLGLWGLGDKASVFQDEWSILVAKLVQGIEVLKEKAMRSMVRTTKHPIHSRQEYYDNKTCRRERERERAKREANREQADDNPNRNS